MEAKAWTAAGLAAVILLIAGASIWAAIRSMAALQVLLGALLTVAGGGILAYAVATAMGCQP